MISILQPPCAQMPIRTFLVSSALVATILACGGSGGTSPAPPSSATTVDVFTIGDSFSPFSVSVGVGSTVRLNIVPAPDGTGHNVVFAASPTGAPANINVVA